MGRRKKENKMCISCEVNPRYHTYSRCKECNSIKTRASRASINSSIENLSVVEEFVERIRRRRGMASLEEIFVEMITIHQTFCNDFDYKHVPAGKQLERIWIDIQSIYDAKKKNRL